MIGVYWYLFSNNTLSHMYHDARTHGEHLLCFHRLCLLLSPNLERQDRAANTHTKCPCGKLLDDHPAPHLLCYSANFALV